MASDDLIVGLDIGSTKVAAVIGEYDENDTLQITGIGESPSYGLRRGVVINIESTLKSVNAAIEAAEQMAGREAESVVTGIAGGHIEGLNSRGVVAVTGKGREITQNDIDRVIDAAKAVVIPMDREVLHVIPQEFIVDDQGGIRNPLDMIGVRLEAEVHIITGSVTSAQNLVKCINRSGFKVEDIVLQSLASSKAVLSRDEQELGVLLVDLGGGTTDVLLHIDGAPYYTSVLPVGGAQVTSDLSIVLKTPMDSAEAMKKDSGCCYAPLIEEGEPVIIPGVGGRPPLSVRRRDIAAIIEPRMAEIFSLVRERIEKKGLMKHLGGGVVLTGGGALLSGAVELAQDVFQTAARVGQPGNLGGAVSRYQRADFATVIGLLLYRDAMVSASERDGQRKERQPRMMEGFKSWLRNFFE
ncbi:MAG: cell division protein FtsA [Spirochaetaceae bacterium]|nr:MAG: cell division protein FtsA [Spirochaetaceae bacterium]